MSSPSGLNALQTQTDGNVVERVGGAAVWSTGTAGSGAGARLCLQTDGNLVLRSANGTAVWQSASRGATGAYTLSLQDDGNLVLRDGAGKAAWVNGAHADTLRPGAVVRAGQSLVSAGAGHTLTVQSDGNVVLRNSGGTALWTTGTVGHSGSWLTLQTDGNIVLRDAGGSATWASGTAGSGGTAATLQTDGNLVLRKADGSAVWSRAHGVLTSDAGLRILQAAEDEIGTPYTFAGGNTAGPTNPANDGEDITGYDCSGLSLYAVYRGTGKVLTHNARAQYADRARWGGVVVADSDLRPGDLVFFGANEAAIHHVGIYAGNGQMVDAPTDGVPVGRHGIAGYGDYYGAVRFSS